MNPTRADALEAFTNAALGLLVSWAVTYYLLPYWGLKAIASASLGITMMYFSISFLRSYVVRVTFRRLGGTK